MVQENEVRLPGISEEAVQTNKEIFAHFTGAEIIEGITIAFGAAGTLEAGTVLGRDAGTGKYAAYADTTGTDPARCVLRSGITVTEAGDALGEAVFGQAVLKHDQLVGLDAGAVADLGGVEDTVRNTFTF